MRPYMRWLSTTELRVRVTQPEGAEGFVSLGGNSKPEFGIGCIRQPAPLPTAPPRVQPSHCQETTVEDPTDGSSKKLL